MTILSCDIECNGLLDTVTKLHCLSIKSLYGDTKSYIGSYESFFETLQDGDTLVWHNGFGYDLEALKKLKFITGYNYDSITLLDGTKLNVQFIDTLAMSREWWPDRPSGHGLHSWAKQLGTFKPEVDDWDNLPVEVYVDRCENDVVTTEKLLVFLCEKLGVDL